MKDAELEALGEVTEALYRAEVVRMQHLVTQENRLREALARLDAKQAATRALPDTELDGLRQIGGDMIWQGWMGARKAELQSELARVLGRKGQMIGKLRRAFGKAQAVDRMTAAARAQAVSNAQARDEDMRAHFAVLDRWMHG
ncbi:MAG: hypothetical protein R6V26_13145 [Roseovarius sp.]